MTKKYLIANIKLIYAAATIVAAGALYWYVSTNTAPSLGSFTVLRGDVVQKIDEPGNVLAENSVALSFQEPGQIANVYVKEGDVVSAGSPLVGLDRSSLAAGADQANAALAAAEAKLEGLMNGTRPEQLQIDESAVANAKASLDVSIGSAYAAADDAIRNQTDNLFSTPQTNAPLFLVPLSDSQMQIDIQTQRILIGGALSSWYGALRSSSTDQTSLARMSDKTLRQIASYLNTVALGVNNATPNAGMTTAVLAQYKLNVSTARTEVVAAMNSLAGTESALASAQDQLALAQAGATAQDIDAQKAAVAQAKAAASSAQVLLDHALLRAPFGGTVRDLTGKIGRVVSPGVPVVSVTNNNGLKIETYVSEADVAKIKTGDKADITLDAYGTQIPFPAAVTTIDSAETSVNGTPAYKVTLHFTTPDSRIKDGMTANVHIITAESTGAIEVPDRLIIKDGGNYFVLVRRGGSAEKRPVRIGIVGADGMTEITSGLNVGDQINNF